MGLSGHSLAFLLQPFLFCILSQILNCSCPLGCFEAMAALSGLKQLIPGRVTVACTVKSIHPFILLFQDYLKNDALL